MSDDYVPEDRERADAPMRRPAQKIARTPSHEESEADSPAVRRAQRYRAALTLSRMAAEHAAWQAERSEAAQAPAAPPPTPGVVPRSLEAPGEGETLHRPGEAHPRSADGGAVGPGANGLQRPAAPPMSSPSGLAPLVIPSTSRQMQALRARGETVPLDPALRGAMEQRLGVPPGRPPWATSASIAAGTPTCCASGWAPGSSSMASTSSCSRAPTRRGRRTTVTRWGVSYSGPWPAVLQHIRAQAAANVNPVSSIFSSIVHAGQAAGAAGQLLGEAGHTATLVVGTPEAGTVAVVIAGVAHPLEQAALGFAAPAVKAVIRLQVAPFAVPLALGRIAWDRLPAPLARTLVAECVGVRLGHMDLLGALAGDGLEVLGTVV